MTRAGLTLMAAIAFLATSGTPVAAIECSARNGEGKSWRLIDGRRCYYEGRRRIDKRRLHWASATEARSVSVAVRSGEPDARGPVAHPPRRRQGPPEPTAPMEVAAQPEPGPVVRMVSARPIAYTEQPAPEPRVVLPSPYEPKKIEQPPPPRRGWIVGVAVLFWLGFLGVSGWVTYQLWSRKYVRAA
jgi:hypothetical protein